MFKNLFNKNNFCVLLTNFLLLKLIIELDGNISLRYFSDELYKIYEFETLSLTMDYIILFIAIFIYITKIIVRSLKIELVSNYSIYIFNFFIYSSCLLITLLFFRIYDVERLYLLIYIIVIPFLDIVFTKYMTSNLVTISIPAIFVIIIILFNYTDQKTLISNEDNFDEAVAEANILNFQTFVESEFDLSNEYRFTRTQICCDEYAFYDTGGKSLGYLEIFGNNLFHITGTGVLLNYDINKLVSNIAQTPKLIETNIAEIIQNSFIVDLENWESIKDILILENNIFVSFIEEPSEDCTNVQIIKGELNFQSILFEKLFEYDECAQRGVSPYNAHQSGGKLLALDNETIALTTGDYRRYKKPQDIKSLFGKVLSIDLKTKKSEVISLGHRNPQGLSKTNNSNFLVSTEHGPKGGDEINIINVNQQENFGWPLASYGNHYDGLKKPDAPLKKNHLGFKEPVWYFSYSQNDSHGISNIEINHFSTKDSFFVGTMKAGLLYEVEIDLFNNKLDSLKTYKVGDRIRDFIYHEESKSYIFLLEERPSFGVLKEKISSNLDFPYFIPNN